MYPPAALQRTLGTPSRSASGPDAAPRVDRVGVEHPPADVHGLALREAAAPRGGGELGALPLRLGGEAARRLLPGADDLARREHGVVGEQQHAQMPRGAAAARCAARAPMPSTRRGTTSSPSASRGRLGQPRRARRRAARECSRQVVLDRRA